MSLLTNPRIKQLIKDINSNYVRADLANREFDYATEAKHLWHALHDCNVLIGDFFLGYVDKELAITYAHSVTHSAKRIEEIVKKKK